MKLSKLPTYLLSAAVICMFFVTGCSGDASDGHTSDPTPGGEETPPAEELMDDSSFDDYAKQQAAGSN